ncbi:CsbD family protein [Nocardia gipuzkoensis]
MSIRARFAHRTHAAKGTVEKLFGRATGPSRLRCEGRLDQVTGDLDQSGDNLRDAFEH